MTLPNNDQIPLLEFDPNPRAFINAADHSRKLDIPSAVVLCFFHDVIEQMVNDGTLREVYALRSEMGAHPLFVYTMPNGGQICLMHPSVGGPIGSALIEELIGHGIRQIVAIGGAGSLQQQLTVGHVVVPTMALRDEGTSYHYVAPSRWIAAQPAVTQVIREVLTEQQIPYVEGPTWTTDAFYRETVAKVERRRNEGCLTVEMENASFLAVAQLRNVQFGQILYSGDDLSSEVWDSRAWHTHANLRHHLTVIATEVAWRLQQ
ncbi:MAG: nucleoside phosphorylase [Chloroflexales bacterium]|nr:nucleoside phosphorylase [Chloroflexales bacterium]